jgi:LmbE family N-acetylglucosaminyl deacetylase
MHRLICEGQEIHYVAFSTAEESVPPGFPKDVLKKEVRAATTALGIPEHQLHIRNYAVRKLNYVRQEILEDLVYLKRHIRPDLVFMPSLTDLHQDHETVAKEGLRAFKDTCLLGYELLWNNLNFNTACFFKLDVSNVEAKCTALKAYVSQADKDYMSRDFIYAHARTRGVQARTTYAEAFETVRWIL